MKLSEFIEKYGDRKVDEGELMETLHIKDKARLPDVGGKQMRLIDKDALLKHEIEGDRMAQCSLWVRDTYSMPRK